MKVAQYVPQGAWTLASKFPKEYHNNLQPPNSSIISGSAIVHIVTT